MENTQSFKYVELASYQHAKNNSYWSGDAFFCSESEGYFICAVSDGLGSGQYAYEASKVVMDYIQENHHEELTVLMENCNRLLLNKRGVVLSILKVDYINKEIIYSNAGNINCIFYSPDGVLTRTIPKRGFLSGKKLVFTTQHLPYKKGMRFIIFTDGLDLKSTVQKTITKENSVAAVIHTVRKIADFKKDDTMFVVGDVFI
ncbi:PP2C family serine/threonine-protein phosphatase [Anaerobacillus isosaccharinicus]|uniref:SpoIIE family protein phosphatase n=1 Tax=Anaerobacillus isosaccharinicus TaxID=1532552 RepID=A0A1S2MFY1_9BACI|nr:PP2C family serine/threonine-protein phosphatase [Anaerobacillus isosaccharinicus]MBA5588817.1 SpoIIE family protein phosphatase [Anaerobacillus isosaccharinicus]QOY37791.1 SpoIIE family protein phosphatase [Anaerobacillus isosaccharinicus]